MLLTTSHIADAYFDHMPDTPHVTGTVKLQTQCHQVTKQPIVQISITVDILPLPEPRLFSCTPLVLRASIMAAGPTYQDAFRVSTYIVNEQDGQPQTA